MAGLLSRLLGRPEAPAETRSAHSLPPGYAAAFGVSPMVSGAYVSPHMAENLAGVLACINAISSVMASMTPRVYRLVDKGRVELADHPVSRLTRRPNADQTWPDWMEWTLAQVLLHGNAVSAIDYDAAGRVTALQPLPWGMLSIYRLPTGRLAYDVVEGEGRVRRYFADEVFHLRDRSDDGVIGRSRISRAREVLGNAIALQEFARWQWQNQARPSGVLQTDEKLTREQAGDLRTAIDERWVGTRNAGQVPILTWGMKFQPMSVSPEDAEVLASRRFTVEELCRLFQVPPPIVQDLSHGTFTNSREAGRWFAQFSLAPWARKIEAEFRRSVFGTASADCTLEIDMSDLLRGDAEARWQSHKIAVDAGILDPDEIREIEGWNPRAEQPTSGPTAA
ncbi:phage portal protein [Roseomonas nepalensis]|uniref:Phage portal protein n=1 Tax=Muricoccus nepalensis TaxID=1854500 RepID=A0A502F4R1_9PROT|nr:phage portal protein [Roseomonas nepalensis]TPG44224.1 phage portal protein [Roseomonas nepalensis]